MSEWKLLYTHRKSPPAVYCVIEKRTSSGVTEMLECVINAEGMKMLDPAGNSMMSHKSHRIRCLPIFWSKFPIVVMTHRLSALFPLSVCSSMQVLPKLTVVASKTLLLKFFCKRWSDAWSVSWLSQYALYMGGLWAWNRPKLHVSLERSLELGKNTHSSWIQISVKHFYRVWCIALPICYTCWAWDCQGPDKE